MPCNIWTPIITPYNGEGIMDINTIVKIVKSIPKDKLNDEKTLKKVIRDAVKASGKTISDDQLNKYVQQFKSVSKSPLSLISMLLKNGVNMQQINEIKKKMK
jgi:uncharacterized protein YpuA (DUF1002 family)